MEKDIYTYDGKPKTPKVTVEWDGGTITSDTCGEILTLGEDYKVSYSDNVGTGKVAVTGKGNYTGRVEKHSL